MAHVSVWIPKIWILNSIANRARVRTRLKTMIMTEGWGDQISKKLISRDLGLVRCMSGQGQE